MPVRWRRSGSSRRLRPRDRVFFFFFFFIDISQPRRATSCGTGCSTSSTTGTRCASRLWQAHEGDWESISVGARQERRRRSSRPTASTARGPCARGTAVEKRGGTHPVAYVALGSHANYFTNPAELDPLLRMLQAGADGKGGAVASRIISLAQEKIVDRTGTAHPLGPAGLGGRDAAVARGRSTPPPSRGRASRDGGARGSCSGSATVPPLVHFGLAGLRAGDATLVVDVDPVALARRVVLVLCLLARVPEVVDRLAVPLDRLRGVEQLQHLRRAACVCASATARL